MIQTYGQARNILGMKFMEDEKESAGPTTQSGCSARIRRIKDVK